MRLVPIDARELRDAGFSVLHWIDAVLEVFVARARRVLLRRVFSKVCPFAICLPFVSSLVPADSLEVRGARWSGNNAVIEVLSVRARRSFLRGVIAQVLPLAERQPFASFLDPGDAYKPRRASVAGTTALPEYRGKAGLLLVLRLLDIIMAWCRVA